MMPLFALPGEYAGPVGVVGTTVRSPVHRASSWSLPNREQLDPVVGDALFAAGKGPDPATKDNATDFVGVEQDPFQ